MPGWLMQFKHRFYWVAPAQGLLNALALTITTANKIMLHANRCCMPQPVLLPDYSHYLLFSLC